MGRQIKTNHPQTWSLPRDFDGHGTRPGAQIQAKARSISDMIRNVCRSPEGLQAGEQVAEGMGDLIDLAREGPEGGPD